MFRWHLPNLKPTTKFATFAPFPNHFRGFSYLRPLSQALWFATQRLKKFTISIRDWTFQARFATPVGTERSQIAQIAPKWLGESARGGLGLRCGSAEQVSCTGAKEVCTGARDFFCTSALEPQTALRAHWGRKSRLKSSIPATHHGPSFWGHSEGQDWIFQARLKLSSEIENLRAPSSTPTPKTPETQTMVWVFLPRTLDYGLSFSFPPNKYRVWGGLSFGPSFSRTMVWVSSSEGRNTEAGVDKRALKIGGLRKDPPFHGSRSSREIKLQNASCQMGGREVTKR